MEEIGCVNDSLSKLEVAQQEARKSTLNILEETFTSKSSSVASPRQVFKSMGLHKQQKNIPNQMVDNNQISTVRNPGYVSGKPQLGFVKQRNSILSKRSEDGDVVTDLPLQMPLGWSKSRRDPKSKTADVSPYISN